MLYNVQENTFRSSSHNPHNPHHHLSPTATSMNRNLSFNSIDSVGKDITGLSDGTMNPSSREDDFDAPILWKSRKTCRLPKNLSSFSWLPTGTSSSSSSCLRFLTINKDAGFERVFMDETPQFSWEPKGNLTIFGPKGIFFDVDKKSNERDGGGGGESNGKGNGGKDIIGDNNIKDSSKKQSKTITIQQSKSLDESFVTSDKDNESLSDSDTLKLMEEDISVVIRRRAKCQYSMNCKANQEIVRGSPKLEALWNWMAWVSDENSSLNTDYKYNGVHSVWTASSISLKKPPQTPISTPRTPSLPPHSTSPSSEKIDMIDYSDEIPTALTAKVAQRKLALNICGWGFGKNELEKTLQRMEASGNYEKAAGWALFHMETDRAIKALSNSKDEKLKLVSTALAGFSFNKNQENSIWRGMCKQLSLEMKEPYLRAIFSYISSQGWDNVLNDEELELRDRVGIAIRFMDDEKLTNYLYETTEIVKKNGDLSGIILTGLTSEGITLFENYVNNTADVQTASLALSYCVPRYLQDSRVDQWVESYRSLLDKWEMFHTRAQFDILRGKFMDSSTTSAAYIASPQVYVRCDKCSQSIAHNLFIPVIKGKNIGVLTGSFANGGGFARPKVTCCPGCHKNLPRCSICLLGLGTANDILRKDIAMNQHSGGFNKKNNRNSNSNNNINGVNGINGNNNKESLGIESWFTWCQSCRHGGHAIHMYQWFANHKVCPVSECQCECEFI
ncbi:hypothetical protein Glove_319g166 [Diversispora epigaea]|uniref:Uncharacterized protein n=1 Tax=Diversispora epigaea TaxID=1348612 RepID=A0A397HV61_9GLOM|nr:hypothetical protein Glove_319g166 [Diversispora epigaea]